MLSYIRFYAWELMKLFAPVLVVVFSFCFDLNSIIPPNLDVSGLFFGKVFSAALTYGSPASGLFLALLIGYYIYKSNNKKIFNLKGIYISKEFVFKIASYVGYQECNLVNMPIYIQYRLLISRVFTKFTIASFNIEENDFHCIVPQIEIFSSPTELDTIILILEDTYEIKNNQIEDQISKISSNKSIQIKVSRYSGTKIRKSDLSFVNAIRQVIAQYATNTTIHIFATTNPQNNMRIFEQCFASLERDTIKKIYVYEQSKEGARIFDKKYCVFSQFV
jgi:hypothetical protein